MSDKRRAKGSGAFRRTPSGKLNYRRTFTREADGATKSISVTADTEAGCIKLMEQKRAAWEEEVRVSRIRSDMTVSELCTAHLQYQNKRKLLEPTSSARREVTIAQIESTQQGHLTIDNFTGNSMDDMMEEIIAKDLSYSSCKKVLDAVNAAFNWALTKQIVSVNPVIEIKKQIVKRLSVLQDTEADDPDVDIIADEDIDKFEKTCLMRDDKGKYIYYDGTTAYFLLNTGLRIGECLALRWNDIDFSTGILTVDKKRTIAKDKNGGKGNIYTMREGKTKNKKARNIKLNVKALNLLRTKYAEAFDTSPDQFIFLTSRNHPNTISNAYANIKKIYIAADCRNADGEYIKGQHILRRTFATGLYYKNVPIETIAEYIGDLVSTTQKYYIAIRKKSGENVYVEIPEEQETDNPE